MPTGSIGMVQLRGADDAGVVSASNPNPVWLKGSDVASTEVKSGTSASYNITTATVVKASPGRVAVISVVSPGATAGAVHDCATTGAAAAGNKIATVPVLAATISGILQIDWPCATGIVVVPGTSQVISVSYT